MRKRADCFFKFFREDMWCLTSKKHDILLTATLNITFSISLAHGGKHMLNITIFKINCKILAFKIGNATRTKQALKTP